LSHFNPVTYGFYSIDVLKNLNQKQCKDLALVSSMQLLHFSKHHFTQFQEPTSSILGISPDSFTLQFFAFFCSLSLFLFLSSGTKVAKFFWWLAHVSTFDKLISTVQVKSCVQNF